MPILKIKGKFFLQFKQYREAKKLYVDLLESHKLPWIYAGAGKACYLLEEYEESKKYFNKIINENNANVDAYDWLAKIDIAEGKYEEAQKTLLKDVEMSPHSVKRQQILGDISYENGDFDVAADAYKQACNLGKYSVFRRPKDFLNFAEIKLLSANEEGVGREKVAMAKEAIAMLDVMGYLFSDDWNNMFTCNAKKARGYLLLGKKDKARMACRQTIETIIKHKVVSSSDENTRFIKLLLELECDKEVKTLTDKYPDSFEAPEEEQQEDGRKLP